MQDSKKNYIIGCQISGVFDVNRNEILPNDDFSLLINWYNSILSKGLSGIIFHNSFSEATCAKYQNDRFRFIKIEYDSRFNPNVYRYKIYNDFLQENQNNIQSVFFTDVSDVLVLKNPFEEALFIQNNDSIFCGDEDKILNNDWMNAHSEHLRNAITDYVAYELKYQNEMLLNCGIIGGSIATIKKFVQQLWAIHLKYNSDNTSQYTGDMGAFNYLARTRYLKKSIHGSPINTVFKNYDTKNSDCWFAHK